MLLGDAMGETESLITKEDSCKPEAELMEIKKNIFTSNTMHVL